jgi:ATP-dependent DNA ligase
VFDVLAIDGEDVRELPLSMRKVHLDRLLRSRPDGIFINPFEIGGIRSRSIPGGLRHGARGIGVEAQ